MLTVDRRRSERLIYGNVCHFCQTCCFLGVNFAREGIIPETKPPSPDPWKSSRMYSPVSIYTILYRKSCESVFLANLMQELLRYSLDLSAPGTLARWRSCPYFHQQRV
jgi:hypothetical protein